MNRFLLLSCLCGVSLTSIGCSGNVNRGRALYADGYYVEAAEVFERNEKRLSEWPPEKRAAYGLYRSMTLLQLGDVSGAQRWIHYAHWVEGHSPGALDSSEQQLLAQTETKLNARLQSEPAPSVAGTPGAVAAKSGQSPDKVTGTESPLVSNPTAPTVPAAPRPQAVP